MKVDACVPVVITGADGATLTVCAYGGQVLGWAPQPGQERLWLSPATRCGGGQAIRGGVPVIFPQFSARGPLPKHGIARARAWNADPVEDPLGAAWHAWLGDDDATRAIWPHAFGLDLRVRATSGSLELTLQVTNRGQEPWSFALALHTYLAVDDEAATLTGLSGHATEQNAHVGVIHPGASDGPANEPGAGGAGEPGAAGAAAEPGPAEGPAGAALAWRALEPRDVRVLDLAGPVELHQPSRAPLTLTAPGFADRVVWNPGPGHGLADVPDGGERRFVCCEPAVVDPIELDGGQTWTGRQVLSI
jgi:glucose-6-phosphate 1-epimerase